MIIIPPPVDAAAAPAAPAAAPAKLTPAERASNRFDSRKWRAFVGVLLAAGLFQAFRIPLDPAMVELVKWAMGMYFTANVGAAAVQAAKEYFAPTPAPAAPVEPAAAAPAP